MSKRLFTRFDYLDIIWFDAFGRRTSVAAIECDVNEDTQDAHGYVYFFMDKPGQLIPWSDEVGRVNFYTQNPSKQPPNLISTTEIAEAVLIGPSKLPQHLHSYDLTIYEFKGKLEIVS